MIPKQKAEELYNAYKKALNINNDMRAGANPYAKECALICVSEIINDRREMDYLECGKIETAEIIAPDWVEVKQAIEAL